MTGWLLSLFEITEGGNDERENGGSNGGSNEGNRWSIPSWRIEAEKIYRETRNGFFVSPPNSLLMKDELDGSDSYVGGPDLDIDAFGQIFTVPLKMTSIMVFYSARWDNPNPTDILWICLWPVKADGELEDRPIKSWPDTGGDSGRFYSRQLVLSDPGKLALLAGRKIMLLAELESNRHSPSAWVWLDDIQVKVCDFHLYLPAILKLYSR